MENGEISGLLFDTPPSTSYENINNPPSDTYISNHLSTTTSVLPHPSRVEDSPTKTSEVNRKPLVKAPSTSDISSLEGTTSGGSTPLSYFSDLDLSADDLSPDPVPKKRGSKPHSDASNCTSNGISAMPAKKRTASNKLKRKTRATTAKIEKAAKRKLKKELTEEIKKTEKKIKELRKKRKGIKIAKRKRSKK